MPEQFSIIFLEWHLLDWRSIWVTSCGYSGRLKTYTAILIGVFPIAFIRYDRPEALCYLIACAAIAYAARPGTSAVLAGILIGLTFLSEPFGAIVVSVWVAALFLLQNWKNPRRWSLTVIQAGIAALSAALVLIPIALLYHSTDPTSLTRFANHAFGYRTGLGIALQTHKNYLQKFMAVPFLVALTTPSLPTLFFRTAWLFSPIVLMMFMAWTLVNRKKFVETEWILLAAGFASALLTIILFPFQPNYLTLLAFFIPSGLLIAGKWSSRLSIQGLSLPIAAIIFIDLPGYGISVLFRIEQRSSYLASLQQPSYLLAHLPSPDAMVSVIGGDYDLYKPEFHHMFGTFDLDVHRNGIQVHDDDMSMSQLEAVANCYYGFKGGPGSVRPFPSGLNAADFHLIQPAPEHLWITFFGHRISNTQRGYGCDLYVKNAP